MCKFSIKLLDPNKPGKLGTYEDECINICSLSLLKTECNGKYSDKSDCPFWN